MQLEMVVEHPEQRGYLWWIWRDVVGQFHVWHGPRCIEKNAIGPHFSYREAVGRLKRWLGNKTKKK